MGKEYFNRYNSYCKSVGNLEECRSADLNDVFVLPGIVQCFNLSFDLAWKVMKHTKACLRFRLKSESQTGFCMFSYTLNKVINNNSNDYTENASDGYLNGESKGKYQYT